jgi:hypothetical protein
MDDDLLFTNSFVKPFDVKAVYDTTDEFRRGQLREKIEADRRVNFDISENEEAQLEDSDLLKTNPVIDDNMKLKNFNVSRYVKERRSFVLLDSIQRAHTDTSHVVPRNSETGLYTREVTDSEGDMQIQLYNSTILNNEFVPGPEDYPVFPYFTRWDGNIGFTKWKYREPDSYIIRLPRIFTNVKSISLVEAEIPNTLYPINKYNSLVTIDIVDNVTGRSVLLKNDASYYPYFVIQLRIGAYTLDEVVTHLQNRVNEVINDLTVDEFDNLFTISLDKNSGEVLIKLNSVPGRDLKFHWKFQYIDQIQNESLPLTQYSNLWYTLGFSQPYESNSDGSDKYVTERTNLFDFGMNPTLTGVPESRTEYHLSKPYRFPDIAPHRYILLSIAGLNNLEFYQNPLVTNIQNKDIFARIPMNSPVGDVVFYKNRLSKVFVDTPLDRLTEFEVSWLDYAGIPVDFNGRDHSLLFEIVEYIDKLESADFSSQRGTIDTTAYSSIVQHNL